jgi:hypothetical protein
LVSDLKEEIKQLKEDLREANSRAATAESNFLHQQMNNQTGADKRQVSLSFLSRDTSSCLQNMPFDTC